LGTPIRPVGTPIQ